MVYFLYIVPPKNVITTFLTIWKNDVFRFILKNKRNVHGFSIYTVLLVLIWSQMDAAQ